MREVTPYSSEVSKGGETRAVPMVLQLVAPALEHCCSRRFNELGAIGRCRFYLALRFYLIPPKSLCADVVGLNPKIGAQSRVLCAAKYEGIHTRAVLGRTAATCCL